MTTTTNKGKMTTDKRKKVLVFHHSDLDGMGVKFIGVKVAVSKDMPYETYNCNYHTVNDLVFRNVSRQLKYIDTIIIGDISVDEDTAEILDEWQEKYGFKLILRDHHATAEYLNKYDWAYVAEFDESGVPYCGTYLLANDFPEIQDDWKVFIEAVDDWDTWKWVNNQNHYAKDLESLFQTLGEEEFTKYMFSVLDNHPKHLEDLFTDWAETIIQATDMMIEKTAKSCEKHMMTTVLDVKGYSYFCGIVFCNSQISEVSEILLSKHDELDLLMLVGFPRNISFRSKKNLEVPLGDIAKYTTGAGGGHPQSAGAVVSAKQITSFIHRFLNSVSDPEQVYYDKPTFNF